MRAPGGFAAGHHAVVDISCCKLGFGCGGTGAQKMKETRRIAIRQWWDYIICSSTIRIGSEIHSVG